jgi:hypothetical protein
MAPRRLGTGYINPGQFLEANQGAGTRLAGQLASDIEGQAGQYGQQLTGLESQFQNQLRNDKPVMSLGAMPGYEDLARRAAQVSMRARQAGTSGGTGALLAEQGGGMRTPGGAAYDAFYARAAPGGDRLGNLAAQYGDLSKALGVRNTASEATAGTILANRKTSPAYVKPPPPPKPPSVTPEDWAGPAGMETIGTPAEQAGEFSFYPFAEEERQAEKKRVRDAARSMGF